MLDLRIDKLYCQFGKLKKNISAISDYMEKQNSFIRQKFLEVSTGSLNHSSVDNCLKDWPDISAIRQKYTVPDQRSFILTTNTFGLGDSHCHYCGGRDCNIELILCTDIDPHLRHITLYPYTTVIVNSVNSVNSVNRVVMFIDNSAKIIVKSAYFICPKGGNLNDCGNGGGGFPRVISDPRRHCYDIREKVQKYFDTH